MNDRDVVRRVLKMSRGELAFRARSRAADLSLRAAGWWRSGGWKRKHLASRLAAPATPEFAAGCWAVEDGDWTAAHRHFAAHFRQRQQRFLFAPAVLPRLAATVRRHFPHAAGEAAARADRMLEARHDLLGYRDVSFAAPTGAENGPQAAPRAGGNGASDWVGAPIAWQWDPLNGRDALRGWWSSIDYLDPGGGDHKVIWELNRHQHWLALGRAAWLTGDTRYRARFVSELESWLAANPPFRGVNWASMLELGFRALSWIAALELFVDRPLRVARGGEQDEEAPWLVDLLLGLDTQLEHVARNLSVYFSPNTHLTGEALALYVAGSCLPELAASRRWADAGRRILIEQAARQVTADGGHAERSTQYHHYSLDFYLMALAVARLTGDAAAERTFADAAARQASFAEAMADQSGRLPLIGDDDGGSLMPICGRPASDVSASLDWARVMLPDALPDRRPSAEEAVWLTGGDPAAVPGRRRWNARAAARRPQSRTFPSTGYHVLRSAHGDQLVLDAGQHGYLNGGHAHADALSTVLVFRGRPLLVDPGTFTYTMSPALRDHFRSTAAHNTVVLDGRSQSEPDGPFHWRSAASAALEAWRPNPRFDYVEASHDGYRPVTHRRAIFTRAGEEWVFADELRGSGRHRADVHWHLDPAWRVAFDGGRPLRLEHPDGLVAWLLTDAPSVEVFVADRRTLLGWVSPVYGALSPAATVRFSKDATLPYSLVTALVPGRRDGPAPSIERLATRQVAEDVTLDAVRVGLPESTAITVIARPWGGGDREYLSWDVEGIEADARCLHLTFDPAGRVRSLSLVDGHFLATPGPHPLILNLAAPAADLSVTFDHDHGAMFLDASEPPPEVRLSWAEGAFLPHAFVNGRAAHVERQHGWLVIRPAAGDEHAPTALAERAS